MQVKPVAEIAEFLAPIAEELDVEIIEIKWDMRTGTLALFIDAPGGVDMNLCEKFHRAVDGPLDELDPTFGAAYTLSCSSAGLDRPFRTKRDFERHMGEQVEIRLYAQEEGKKVHVGKLLSYDGKTVRLAEAEGEREYPLAKVAKASLFIEV